MFEQVWDLLAKTAANPFAVILLPIVLAYLSWRLLYEYLTPFGGTLGESLKRDLELIERAGNLGFDVNQYREACQKRLHNHLDDGLRRELQAVLIIVPTSIGTITTLCIALYYVLFGNNLLFFGSINAVLVILAMVLYWKLDKYFTRPEEASEPSRP